MAHVLTVNANQQLVVHNGIAYGLVAGGATSFIKVHDYWYTGNNPTLYVATLLSLGRPLPDVVALMAVRGAIVHAAANNAAELGGLVNAGNLQLNAAEHMGTGQLAQLLDRSKLNGNDWNQAANAAAVAAVNAGNPVPVVGGAWLVDRLPDALVTELQSENMVLWAQACARTAYSLIAAGGIGLITAGHHLRGNIPKMADNILKLYEMDKLSIEVGLLKKQTINLLFHTACHPLDYNEVANWVMAIPAAAATKIAAPINIRLPCYPGGVTFVKNAMTVRRVLSSADVLAAVWATYNGSAADNRLTALDTNIRGAVLNYSAQFRPAQWQGNIAAVDACKIYVVCLFATYDRYMGIVDREDAGGPTKGPGMDRLIAEHVTAYKSVVRIISGILTAAAAALPVGVPALAVFIA